MKMPAEIGVVDRNGRVVKDEKGDEVKIKTPGRPQRSNSSDAARCTKMTETGETEEHDVVTRGSSQRQAA